MYNCYHCFLYSDVYTVKLQFLYSVTPALHRRGVHEYPVICLTIMAPSLDTWQPEMYFLTPQLCLFQKSTQLESSSLVFSDQLLSVGNLHLRFFHIISWPDCLFLFVVVVFVCLFVVVVCLCCLLLILLSAFFTTCLSIHVLKCGRGWVKSS